MICITVLLIFTVLQACSYPLVARHPVLRRALAHYPVLRHAPGLSHGTAMDIIV